MLGPLLDMFVQDSAGRLAALEQAVDAGNAKALESAAHAFKSGAGTIRATVLAAALSKVEATARGENLDPITDLLEQIRSEYRGVLSEIKEQFPQ